MSKQLIDRQEQGKIIAEMNGAIVRINEKSYIVNSQSGNGSYNVNANELGWNCSCPDHIYRGVKCKHIYAVELSFAIRKQVEVVKIEPVSAQCCIFCKSFNIVKYGVRHNKNQDIQKYNCRDCNHYFTINLGFEKMHATPQMITTAMQLYFTGESFRNVKQFLKLQGVNMSHVAVYKWIRKYVSLTPRTRHIRHIRLQGDHNNNKMERFNGEVRDRQKTMRGLKNADTPILSGYQIYHNYMRPHEGLNGKTPAEASGIKVEGKNKWITIIENAKADSN